MKYIKFILVASLALGSFSVKAEEKPDSSKKNLTNAGPAQKTGSVAKTKVYGALTGVSGLGAAICGGYMLRLGYLCVKSLRVLGKRCVFAQKRVNECSSNLRRAQAAFDDATEKRQKEAYDSTLDPVLSQNMPELTCEDKEFQSRDRAQLTLDTAKDILAEANRQRHFFIYRNGPLLTGIMAALGLATGGLGYTAVYFGRKTKRAAQEIKVAEKPKKA
jgi:hypothetical protein